MQVNKEQSSLALLKDEEKIAKKEWPEKRDMGRQVLEALRGILEETRLDPKLVEEFRVGGDAPENFTSKRIAETIARVYTFVITQEVPEE